MGPSCGIPKEVARLELNRASLRVAKRKPILPGRARKTDMSDKTFSRRLVDGITMFVVTALSLLLLVYVGFGEGHRSFEQFHIDKVTAQGRIVQNTIESYLRAGLPLD